MKLALRSILGIVALSVYAQSAIANNNNASPTSSVIMQQPKKEGRIWSGLVNANRSSSLIDYQDGSRKDNVDYMTRVNAKINSDYSLRLQGGYSQDLRFPENSDFTDTSLNLLRAPVKVGRNLMLGYRVGATAPTSKDSHKRQSLQTALSTGLSWMINPERIIPGLEISGLVTVSRNIHQYETALDGRVNNQYSSLQSVSVGYELKYGFSVSAEVVHRNAWSYQNVMRDTFELSQEISYQMNSSVSFGVGHTNDGSSLRANGHESNVELVNENTSMVYGSLTATF